MPSAPSQHPIPPRADKPNTSRPRSLIASSLENPEERNALDHSFAAVETAISKVLNASRAVIPFPAGPQGRAVGARPSKTPDESIPMRYATALSAGLHIGTPLVVSLLVLLLALLLSWLLHFNLWDWLNPPKKPDMVFTLVKDTHAERPRDPRFRGQFNQRAGGETNPNQPIAPPETPASEASAAQQAAKPTPPQETPQPPQPPPKPKTPDTPKTDTRKASIQTPKKPAPKPQQATQSQPQQARQAQKAQPTASTANASSASSGAPGTGMTHGNAQGGPGAAGVDVGADVDFGPFMADLERRIKRNWHPPRAGNSKRVKVQFRLARDGRLLDIDILGHSGDPSSDTAALEAVRASAPFRPFPSGVKEESLPIEFTFDYNVFNPRGR
ncbi:MAG: energy transducer TonB [Candidatus Melainabacteria bacterium]